MFFVCTAGSVIKTISTDYWVRGVTSVGDELFVLLQRDANQVAVYSINDYQFQHHIQLRELKHCYFMTSCVQHKCLYMSDEDNKYIHRYDLSSGPSKVITPVKRFTDKRISKWSVPGKPRGLSVTPSSYNLLVACWEDDKSCKLVELRAERGQVEREITLQSDITDLHHAVKLKISQYVVCHGDINTLHRVCMVDAAGIVTRNYGWELGSGVGQLNNPRHLAVDEDSQFIFVADCLNHRVVLLSPMLEFVREFSEGVKDPRRLYFHNTTNTTQRLFVGNSYGDVAVIELHTSRVCNQTHQ